MMEYIRDISPVYHTEQLLSRTILAVPGSWHLPAQGDRHQHCYLPRTRTAPTAPHPPPRGSAEVAFTFSPSRMTDPVTMQPRHHTIIYQIIFLFK
jgi:hypothetical protein